MQNSKNLWHATKIIFKVGNKIAIFSEPSFTFLYDLLKKLSISKYLQLPKYLHMIYFIISIYNLCLNWFHRNRIIRFNYLTKYRIWILNKNLNFFNEISEFLRFHSVSKPVWGHYFLIRYLLNIKGIYVLSLTL